MNWLTEMVELGKKVTRHREWIATGKTSGEQEYDTPYDYLAAASIVKHLHMPTVLIRLETARTALQLIADGAEANPPEAIAQLAQNAVDEINKPI